VHVEYICSEQIPLLMQNNPIKSDRILAFIAEIDSKPKTVEIDGLTDFKFIDII
jgi:predicted ATPase